MVAREIYQGTNIKLVWYPELKVLYVSRRVRYYRDEEGQAWVSEEREGHIYYTIYKNKEAVDKLTYYKEYFNLERA